jgi:hypothetical protein
MNSKAIEIEKKGFNRNDKKETISYFKLLGTSFKFQIKEFFRNSTLHGVRYIAEPDRPFGEK